MKLIHLKGSKRLRRGIAAASVLVLGTGIVAIAANQANAATGCDVKYTVNQWSGGFTANITVTNLGDALSNWTLKWTFGDSGQKVTSGWNGQFAQSGTAVTVTNAAWNGSLGTNATVNPGFQGTWSSANPIPSSFTLNGQSCNGGVVTSAPPSSSKPPSSAPPSSKPPSSAPPSSKPPSSAPPSGTRQAHVTNPYVGVSGYVNPEWKAKAESVSGGSRVSNTPTAVWIDRIAAINGTANSQSNGPMGIRDHLDAALAQGVGYVQFVIYDLPGRDCAALASNGELGPTEIDKYKSDYIDPIAAIEGDLKYGNLRIVNIIEPDSLPNIVTNVSGDQATPACQTMQQNGNYVKGVQYALDQLHQYSNVYTFVDAGHHAWLGWDSNFGPSADMFATVAKGTKAGFASIDGFITNTANYSALLEPYFSINTSVNGTTVRQSKWVDWNYYVDEQGFATAFRSRLIQGGFSSNLNMIIDTSRNGWGGANRPTKASTSTNVDTFVNESRIDRRIHAGNWCNQDGAGLGERPKANPTSGISAYVWIKPPGESDGSSTKIDNSDGKGFDQMCDPTYTGNVHNGYNKTGALSNAPISGAWFATQFAQLMQNAYPPLS